MMALSYSNGWTLTAAVGVGLAYDQPKAVADSVSD